MYAALAQKTQPFGIKKCTSKLDCHSGVNVVRSVDIIEIEMKKTSFLRPSATPTGLW